MICTSRNDSQKKKLFQSKRWLPVLFCFLFVQFVLAQEIHQKTIDSIFKVSETLGTPKEKVDYLSGLTSNARYANYTLAYIKRSEEISSKFKSDDLFSTTYYYYANYYYYNSKLDSSLYYIEKTTLFIDDEKQPLLRAFLKATEAGIFERQGNNAQSIATILESKVLLDKVDTLDLNDVEKVRYKTLALSSINSLANYYNKIEAYDKAVSYYDQGYRLSLQNKSSIHAGIFITNKGDLFLNTKEYTKSLEAFEEGKKLKIEGNAPQRLIVNSDLNLGIAHTHLGNYEKASQILTRTVAYYKDSKISTKLSESLFYRGDLHLKTKAYSKAILDCNEAKILAEKDKNLDIVSKSCNCLFEAYNATGDAKNALVNYQRHVAAKDSIFNEKNIKNQTEQELQYEFNKTQELKNAEIKAKENESKLYSILAIIGFIFASFLSFFFYKNRKKNQLLAKQKKLLEATVDEKNILLRETHHRVKNSFQMVSSLLFIQSETAQNKEAKLAIKEAQNRVRSMVLIHQKLYSKDQLVGIDSREYIEDFTMDVIESNQFENRKLKYKVTSENHVLSIETITPLGLILNELITNVLKHAFKPVNDASLLEILFYKAQDELVLEVIDNGIGMPDSIKESSFGLELIDALSQKLKATLSHQPNTPNGTIVKLTMKRFEIL